MDKIQCVKHGATIGKDNFYLCAENSIYDGIGRIPICKSCLYEIIEDYFKKYKKPHISLYYTCRIMDLAFVPSVFEGIFKPGMSMKATLQGYMRFMNSLGDENNQREPFDFGEHLGFSTDKKVEKPNREKIEPVLVMEDEDYRIQSEVIELVGYDPFFGYNESDQKALYQDLIGYLDDEEIVEDNFLMSTIIDIVITNLQIKKLNFAIGSYMAEPETILDRQSEIKSLISSKKELSKTIVDMAKENNISVKARGGGSGKSSLTLMTERLRELGFEKAEEDFYNQQKGFGWQRVAEISFSAMSEQIKFDENDVADIISEQRELVKEAKERVAFVEEINRQLQVYKIKLEKLLKEAGVEYEQENYSVQQKA